VDDVVAGPAWVSPVQALQPATNAAVLSVPDDACGQMGILVKVSKEL
jgi:hypothetical protein